MEITYTEKEEQKANTQHVREKEIWEQYGKHSSLKVSQAGGARLEGGAWGNGRWNEDSFLPLTAVMSFAKLMEALINSATHLRTSALSSRRRQILDVALLRLRFVASIDTAHLCKSGRLHFYQRFLNMR